MNRNWKRGHIYLGTQEAIIHLIEQFSLLQLKALKLLVVHLILGEEVGQIQNFQMLILDVNTVMLQVREAPGLTTFK